MNACRSLLLILLITVLGTSCTKKNDRLVKGDYLIVGPNGGYVPAESRVYYYLIENGILSEDTGKVMYTVPTEKSGFDFNYILPQEKYKKASDLLSTIPSELLGRNGQYIGGITPDIPTYDVRTTINGTQYKWSLAIDQTGSSIGIQQYVQKLKENF
mgnify:CR=1 FL=1